MTVVNPTRGVDITGSTGSIAVYFDRANPAVSASFSGSISAVPESGQGQALYDEANNIVVVGVYNSGVVGGTTQRFVHAVDVGSSVRLMSNSGIDVGDVDVLSLPALATGSNTIGSIAVFFTPSNPNVLANYGTGTYNIAFSPANPAVNITSIAAGDNNIGNVDIVTMPSVTIGTFPDNEPFNLNQAGGSAIATNSGVVGAGVLRFVHVTDVASSVRLITNNGVDIGDVDVASVVPGTTAANLGKAEDAVHTTGDTGVMALAVSNEANTARAADGDYVPLATDTEGNTRIVGNRDHDAVDAGELVGVGLRAIAHGTNPTAVAAADRTVWYGNRAGVPFILGGHPNVVTLEAAYTTAQTDAAIVTIATGLKIVVTQIQAVTDEATTVGVGLRVGFGATTTPTTTGVILTHPGMVPGAGISRGDGSGILGVGADNEDLRITSEVPTSGSLRILVSYFTVES